MREKYRASYSQWTDDPNIPDENIELYGLMFEIQKYGDNEFAVYKDDSLDIPVGDLVRQVGVENTKLWLHLGNNNFVRLMDDSHEKRRDIHDVRNYYNSMYILKPNFIYFKFYILYDKSTIILKEAIVPKRPDGILWKNYITKTINDNKKYLFSRYTSYIPLNTKLGMIEWNQVFPEMNLNGVLNFQADPWMHEWEDSYDGTVMQKYRFWNSNEFGDILTPFVLKILPDTEHSSTSVHKRKHDYYNSKLSRLKV